MRKILPSPSTRASFGAGVVLLALSAGPGVPWPLWVAWAALTVAAVVTTTRRRRPTA